MTKEVRFNSGYYSKEQCERIKEKMQGKTFMNFDVFYVNCGAWNCNLWVRVIDREETEEEIRDFFIYAALSELSK